jgi:hypothetical protein
MRTFLRTMIFGTALAALGVHVAAQTADPLIGTWELNIAKSKYDPGPAPKSETRTYVVVGQDIKANSKGVDADGKPTSRQLTLNYDGKDRPATGSLDLDALSLKRIDAFTAEFTLKKTGKVVATGTRAISKDGKVYDNCHQRNQCKGASLQRRASVRQAVGVRPGCATERCRPTSHLRRSSAAWRFERILAAQSLTHKR